VACQVETVIYPSWWVSATTVQVTVDGLGTYNVSRTDVELLPQGISIIGPDGAHPTAMAPWHTISAIKQTS
jgi:hypothetical protein